MKLKTLNIFFFIAVCLTLTSLTFHFFTYFPDLRTTKFYIIPLLIIGVFPTFFVGIISTQKLVDKNNPMGVWNDVLKRTPTYLKALIILLIPYVFFNFF